MSQRSQATQKLERGRDRAAGRDASLCAAGAAAGAAVGTTVGAAAGAAVGATVGAAAGAAVGATVSLPIRSRTTATLATSTVGDATDGAAEGAAAAAGAAGTALSAADDTGGIGAGLASSPLREEPMPNREPRGGNVHFRVFGGVRGSSALRAAATSAERANGEPAHGSTPVSEPTSTLNPRAAAAAASAESPARGCVRASCPWGTGSNRPNDSAVKGVSSETAGATNGDFDGPCDAACSERSAMPLERSMITYAGNQREKNQFPRLINDRNPCVVAACRPPIPPLACLISFFLSSHSGVPKEKKERKRTTQGRDGSTPIPPWLSVFFLLPSLPWVVRFFFFRTPSAPRARQSRAQTTPVSNVVKKEFSGRKRETQTV